MASKSRSSQATNQTDNRRVLGEGSISAESGSTVTVLDNGAINRAFDFSERSLSKAFEFGGDSLDFGGDVVKRALEFGLQSQASSSAAMQASTNVLSDAYNDAKGRGALTDYILIGAIAMAGLVAYSAVKK